MSDDNPVVAEGNMEIDTMEHAVTEINGAASKGLPYWSGLLVQVLIITL